MKIFSDFQRFKVPFISLDAEKKLSMIARKARIDALKMTTLAGCGHPGGSLSSIDIYVTIYSLSNVSSKNPFQPDRDRIIVSHGHTSPGVYAVLGNLGFFPIDEAIAHFRQAGSPYEGHVERSVPGIEWGSGNLGQGLSAGCGMAVASKIFGYNNHVFVLMGDGEQQKGQISEARRFAIKYGLTNLTCIVDRNHLQISGATEKVMPQNIEEEFKASGWEVIEIDGHDIGQIYHALYKAVSDTKHCVMILAETIMGKGVSFMENDEKWHGQALKEPMLDQALRELDAENDLQRYRELRSQGTKHLTSKHPKQFEINIFTGKPRLYTSEKRTDNRSAWGKALEDIAQLNMEKPGTTPLVVFDCDLSSSVKTKAFASIQGKHFFQSGIMEHHTAVASGALSTQGVQVFWADFGVFGVDEAYNQQRLNDINETNLKVICTHLGIDVGEDGKTHQCIDYLGLFRNLYNFHLIVPADPNQTDRIIRWVAKQWGNYFIGMGRSKVPIITKKDGTPFFDENYQYTHGKADILREGDDLTIATMGVMAHRAIRVADELSEKGINITVINFSTIDMPDIEALSLAEKSGIIISYEDHNIRSGLGCTLSQWICEREINTKLIKMGISKYSTSGVPEEILRMERLDTDCLKNKIISILKTKKQSLTGEKK